MIISVLKWNDKFAVRGRGRGRGRGRKREDRGGVGSKSDTQDPICGMNNFWHWEHLVEINMEEKKFKGVGIG